ncbi:MAG: YbaY family lipoprotein [Pyrinomonadaceae bacterium]
MKKRISIFLFLLLTTTGAVFGQTSWLDRPLNNWNNANGSVPNAPRTLVAISAQCQSQVRQPDSIADRAVTRAGWSLFGAAQTFGQVTVVNGMAGTDGMCRPSLYNTFVFVGGRFAGTLSPTTMESRSDGSLSQASLNGQESITAEFSRYRSSDALCCPSQTSFVTYSVSTGARALVRANEVNTTQTCPTDGEITTQDNVVSGTVTYRQRIALPATAVLTVKLVDVPRADASAITIVEQRVDTAGKQVPFSFDMAYDRTKIVERNRYAVQAEIRDNGRLIYITDTSYPVITQGNPKNVEINLVPVGGGGQGGGNRNNTIRGTVTYLQRIALAGNSDVRVWLVDSANPTGTPAAETTFSTTNKQVPFQFELRYEQRDIDRQKNYELRAEIKSNGVVRFHTPTGTPVNLRGNQTIDPVELVLSAGSDEPTAITGKSISLSKFGTGSLKIGTRNAQFLVRGSVVVSTDGTATVTVGTIGPQTVFTGKLTYFDQNTLRITITNSGDADASGEIEVSYTDRRLNSMSGNNLIIDGQDVVLRF